MIKQIAPIFVVCAALLVGPSIAAAEMQTPEQARMALMKAKRRQERLERIKRYRERFERVSKHEKGKAPKVKGNSVPELDPSAGHGATVLLIGGVLVLAGRRRRSSPLKADQS